MWNIRKGMERKRKQANNILIMTTDRLILLCIAVASVICACSVEHNADGEEMLRILLDTGKMEDTRSSDPDETLISDLNVFLFDKDGNLESQRYLNKGEFRIDGNKAECDIRWIKGKECHIYVCANFGFRINGIDNVDDLTEYRYHLSYPDEYSRGIPMGGYDSLSEREDNQPVKIILERLMSKISICIDRTSLSKGIKFNVRSIRIGGCPKSAKVFRKSKAMGSGDVFSTGYIKSYSDADDLNIDERPGTSRSVNVYMLENMQGVLLPDAETEKDKILDASDAISQICSYIELKAEYASDSLFSGPEDYLIYRFYLGDGPKDFNVERNCHYHITVKPSGSGLKEDSWRIDKSGLIGYGSANITVQPGKYIEGHPGDDIHIRAKVTPEGTRFSIGMEELEYDKRRGIYDYILDDDGYGVSLHLLKPGSGILYMEAGAPASDSEMIYITVTE